MENQSKEKELYQKYASKVSELLDDEKAREIFDSLSTGKNSYMRIDRVESSSYDVAWIDMIESCIPDLGTIVNNPRLTTKETQDLVPVELARKTNADSVKHLASHTQFIKEVTDEGDVIPNKVLNIGADDEVKTYENRFIATLIRRLVLFVEKRYEFVKKYAVLHDHEVLFFKNESNVNGSDVFIETKVKVVSPKTDPQSITNTKYLERIEQMRQFILYYYNSKFMKKFKNERDVRNPILMTNIIRKNQIYHHCYELYRFLESYDRLGVAYNVDEKYSQFSATEISELNCLMLANYLSLQGKDKSVQYREKIRNYKPTILTSSDDEAFVYGPLLKGPIQFVRVDEPYQRYLDSFVSKDIDHELNKEEKKYYSQEIDVKKLNRKEYDEKVKLLERKKWQKIQFDKEVEARIRQREEEEKRLLQERINARLKEEEEYLAQFRQRLVDEALRFRAKETGQEYEEEEYSYKPSAFTSMRNNIDFSKMSKLDQELLLQQLSLLHEKEDKNEMLNSVEKSKHIDNLPKMEKPSAPKAVGVVAPIPEKKDETPAMPKVVPVVPYSPVDVLTAGTSPEDKEVMRPVDEDDDKINIPVRTVPVYIESEPEPDLDDQYNEAILCYGLLDNQPKENVIYKKGPKIPFMDDDEDGEPFKKIHLLNKAYGEYEEEKKRDGELNLHALLDGIDEEAPEKRGPADPFAQIRSLNKAYLAYEREGSDLSVTVEEKEVTPVIPEGPKNEEPRREGYVLHHFEKGYYISEDNFTMNINEARVYSDYDEAIRDSILSHMKIEKL